MEKLQTLRNNFKNNLLYLQTHVFSIKLKCSMPVILELNITLDNTIARFEAGFVFVQFLVVEVLSK